MSMDDLHLAGAEPEMVYLAFLDVLGFSASVLRNWDEALDRYDALVEAAHEAAAPLGGFRPNISLQVVSDSIVIKGHALEDVILSTQFFLQGAVRIRCLLRGGISYGRHLERRTGPNLLVMSEPLVRAAALEKAAKYPRIVIDPESVSELDAWYAVPPRGTSNVVRQVLWKDGYWCVNPFSPVWFRSGVEIAAEMREQAQDAGVREKYDWFLDFAQDVVEGAPMLPSCPLPGTALAEGVRTLWITDPKFWDSENERSE
jgi:nucleotide-binding universal stress UspA family protein